MPRGILALSRHEPLISQYRGPVILNEETPPVAPPVEPKDPPKDPKDDTEGRISALAEANKELKKQLKAIEDAKKTEEDDKLKKKGDFEKLLSQQETALSTERTAREQLETKVKAYEDYAQSQIKQGLESITDAEKKKSAEAMLEGLSTEEQMKRLPNILKLVGTGTEFGKGTPETKVNGASLDQKKTRYTELLAKPNPTPQEKNERHTLMVELSKVWDEEQAKKKAI